MTTYKRTLTPISTLNDKKGHRPHFLNSMISRISNVLALLLLSSFCCCASSIGTTTPTSITYRAAVINALPFARLQETPSGTYEFSGVQADMLEAMIEYAAAEGISLNFELSPGPNSYNGALDLVANDCNTTENPNLMEDCNKFDLIIGDYFQNPARAVRVDLSPAWYRSAISTLKKIKKTSSLKDVTTLNQAKLAGIPVCLKDGTYYAGVVQEKFPDVNYLYCDNQDLCLEKLKDEECGLYVDNELQCRYRAANDPSLTPTPESFNTQYIVWAIKDDTPHARLLRKWIYQTGSSGLMDRLFFKYFSKELCPVGTAGQSCELPCDPDHGKSDPSGKCICVSAKWTGDDCSIQVFENRNLVPESLKIVAFVMFGISCVVILICLFWLYWKRKAVQVRVMQPLFLCLVLLGCLISSSTVIPITEDDTNGNVPNCQVIPWLYSIGFCVTFGTLFAKIRRTYVMFKSAADMQRTKVSAVETLVVTATVLLVDVIILTSWTLTDPLYWHREVLTSDVFGEPLASIGYCTSNNWKIFAGILGFLHLSLMTAACVLCYLSRNISSEFSEGKYLSIAMVSNLQIFVVGVPVLILVGNDPVTGFFLRTSIVWINDLAVVLLIFGHLIYLVHWGPKSNTIGVKVGRAMKRFNSRRRSSSRLIGEVSDDDQSSFLAAQDTGFSGQGAEDPTSSYRGSPITKRILVKSSIMHSSVLEIDEEAISEAEKDESADEEAKNTTNQARNDSSVKRNDPSSTGSLSSDNLSGVGTDEACRNRVDFSGRVLGPAKKEESADVKTSRQKRNDDVDYLNPALALSQLSSSTVTSR